MIARAAANGLWLLSCLPDWWAFHRARRNVAGVQERFLLDLVRRNAATEFGRRHGFGRIRSVADYQAAVPLSTYEDYREDIAAIGEGRTGVLTSEPVLLMELTSGSTSATKQIPYTAGLKADFQRAIAPWIADLYLHDLRLLLGQSYWSVSPVARRNQRTPGGLPIGFEDDAEYLGGLQRRLMQRLMAVPSAVRFIPDMDAFRYATLLCLVRSRSLGLISVWNPTFLTLLLERLPEWLPQIAADIAAGTCRCAEVPPDVRAALNFPPDPVRAAQILQAGPDPARLWPDLRLVSCWLDASAAPYAPAIAGLLPQARLQGKGLLATEGFVSFPLVGYVGAALAVRSHFFEFLPEGSGSAPPALAHQLERGARYSVVLTTSGGLYRYQLHDRVEVTGRVGQIPLLRFLGKESHVSDRFGEKVNEQHVQAALSQLTADLRPAFAMVACEGNAYTLFIEAPDAADAALSRLGAGLEARLCENFHYQYCRDLGQLAPVRVFRIEPGRGAAAYLQACVALGMRAGDVKPTTLHHQDGWAAAFPGRLIS